MTHTARRTSYCIQDKREKEKVVFCSFRLHSEFCCSGFHSLLMQAYWSHMHCFSGLTFLTVLQICITKHNNVAITSLESGWGHSFGAVTLDLLLICFYAEQYKTEEFNLIELWHAISQGSLIAKPIWYRGLDWPLVQAKIFLS